MNTDLYTSFGAKIGSLSKVPASYGNSLYYNDPYIYMGLGMLQLSSDTSTKTCIMKFNPTGTSDF
jgi:hypothetical protein